MFKEKRESAFQQQQNKKFRYFVVDVSLKSNLVIEEKKKLTKWLNNFKNELEEEEEELTKFVKRELIIPDISNI